VKISAAQNNQWVVLDGLKAGEQVMVDGFQKLRGNAPVKAVPWQPVASGASPGAPPNAASGAGNKAPVNAAASAASAN
jgi:membrane fusion protein (multidrug efflux system)